MGQVETVQQIYNNWGKKNAWTLKQYKNITALNTIIYVHFSESTTWGLKLGKLIFAPSLSFPSLSLFVSFLKQTTR